MPLNAVIQGPLTSPATPRANWPPNLNADCTASVLSTARAISELNGIALVSTWAGQDEPKCEQLAADAAVAGVIETPDPGKPPDTNGPVPDNRLRQALSTWQGLLELERRGATGLVAKIRTDQTIPVGPVHQFANEFLAGLDQSARGNVVFISGAHFRSLFEIDDLVFVGTLAAMKRFFEAQVRLAPFHSGTPSIHGDVVRKHLSWTVGPALGWPAWRCFPTLPPDLTAKSARPRVHADMIGPWVRTLLDFLVPLPRAAWNGMTWRGSPPFSDGNWMPVAERMCFEDRELLKQQGEDFFLRRWPSVFGTRGSGWLRRPLDYALEVPQEMKQGGASRQTVLMRRARRLINRRRFRG
ncbi:MAG TPA: hypothetical protein VGG30_00860 [Pirellulales bacterium]|jgi:hypothetical protein